jgi:hypothetical protein
LIEDRRIEKGGRIQLNNLTLRKGAPGSWNPVPEHPITITTTVRFVH